MEQFEMVLLAISYREGGLCVAGIRLDKLEYVRLTHDGGPILSSDMIIGNRILQLKDVIVLYATKLPINGCHCEDYDLNSIMNYKCTMNIEGINKLYNRIQHSDYVFFDTNDYLDSADSTKLKYSLEFFRVSDFKISHYKKIYDSGNTYDKPQCSFLYNDNRYCNLRVTDSICNGYPPIYAPKKEVPFHEGFIMVSLPNNNLTKDIGFYKFVSGIIYE